MVNYKKKVGDLVIYKKVGDMVIEKETGASGH